MAFGDWLRRNTIERIVQEVPPDLYACELCGEASCTQAKFASCEFRIRSEFLERKHRLDIAKKPESLSQELVHEIDSFEVVPLSPGIFPVTRRSARPDAATDETVDSPARSGFRSAIRRDSSESEPQSVIVERAGPDQSPQTRRSARNT